MSARLTDPADMLIGAVMLARNNAEGCAAVRLAANMIKAGLIDYAVAATLIGELEQRLQAAGISTADICPAAVSIGGPTLPGEDR